MFATTPIFQTRQGQHDFQAAVGLIFYAATDERTARSRSKARRARSPGRGIAFAFGERTWLFDCGLYQGHRDEAERINRTFRFDPAGLDAVVLSHAHLDHTGNLPTLVSQWFRRADPRHRRDHRPVHADAGATARS